MRVKKKYSAAQKFEAAMSVIKGDKTLVEAARDLGCHPNLVRNWKDALLCEGPSVHEKESDRNDQEARIEKLERLIRRFPIENEVKISMADTGVSVDNPYAESWNRTLKVEEVYLSDYEMIGDERRSIKRLHSSIGYKPPEEFEREWLEKNEG